MQDADRLKNEVNTKRKHTKYKPYWDHELSSKWTLMYNSGKLYCASCKKVEPKHIRDVKKGIFLCAQKRFDKLLIKKKRAYCRGLFIKIDKVCDKDPKEFWHYIKRLGPKKKSDIPWEVEVNGQIVTDKYEVLEQWRTML